MGRLIVTLLAGLAGWAVWRWLQGQEASPEQPPMRTTQPPPVYPRPQAPVERAQAPAESAAQPPLSPQPDVIEEAPVTEEQPSTVEIESKPAANGVVPIAEPQPAGASQQEPIEAYCMRCKEQRAIVDAHEETTAKGRRALRGTCAVCGSKMFRFLPDLE